MCVLNTTILVVCSSGNEILVKQTIECLKKCWMSDDMFVLFDSLAPRGNVQPRGFDFRLPDPIFNGAIRISIENQ